MLTSTPPVSTRLPARARWALVVILLAAFWLRVGGLFDQPGMVHDESFYGLDAASALQGRVLPFYPGNGGREGLFIWVGAPFVAILGHEAPALRLVAAFFGVLTIAATFAVGRRLFHATDGSWAIAIGVAGAAIVAGMIALVTLNRIGWRVSAFPFMMAVAAYWFWRAVESPRRRDWAAAGFAFGLMAYSYSSARVTPMIIPGFLALDAIVTRQVGALVGAWRRWIVFAAVAAVTIAPLASYAVLFPESFFQRQALLSPTNESRALLPEHETVATRFVAYVISVLGPGDPYLVHNVPGAPLISPWLAPVFVVGLALLLGRLRAANARFLLVWLAVVLSTAALPRDAAPNTMRVTGMLPALALVPALGMVWIVQQARRWRVVPVAATAAALLLGVVIGEAGWRHTTEWRASPALPLTFDADMVDLASRMTDRGDEPGMAYLIALNPQYAPAYRHATIDFAYRGRAPFAWLRVDETTAPAAVAAAVGDHRTVQVFTRNQDRAAPPDHNELIGFLLRRQGALVAEEQAPWFRIQTYRLVEPIWSALAPHGEQRVDTLFGDALRLESVAAGQSSGHDSVWVVARWRAVGTIRADLKASIRLRDAAGRLVAIADADLLRAPRFEPTSQWAIGDRQASYHLATLPPGLLPGTYRVSAFVYDRATGLPVLSDGQAERPIGVVALRHGSSTPLDEDSAVRAVAIGPASLVGRALPDDETLAGETVSITLYWRAAEPVASSPATVRVVASDGRVIGQVANDDRRDAAPWPIGVLARDVIDIPLDPTAPAGDARVEVGPRDGPYTTIGEISVSARPRSATMPPGFAAVAIPAADFAALAGWTTERRGAQLIVRLAWRSIARTEQNWTVFVHLVTPDGRLIANQDGPPAGGAAPTRSWLPGEIVVDEKAVTLPSDGPVLIRVGFYDNVSGRRATIDGRDAIDLGPIGG